MRTRPASRLRRILSVAAAASIGLIPAVLVATPAHAGAGDITVSADLEQTEGDTFVFEVRRTGGVGLQPVTLTYDTIAGAVPAADVSSGTTSDLTRLAGETVFAASTRDVVKQFKVVTKDDALNEDAENFILEFRDKVSTNVVTEAYGIIDDNDDKPTYKLEATDPAAEGIGNVTVKASIDKVSGRDVTIPYWTTAGSATDGDDYTGVDSQTPADLVIPAGQTSKTATIAIDDDTLDEEDSETFSVVGGNAPNATKGTTTTQVVNISDNDQPPVVSITGPGNTAEGTPMDFGVNLSAPSGRDVKVRVTSSDGGAKAGADYDLYDQELTITHGQTSVNAQVTTTTDTLDEVNPETFTMTLSATPTNATRSTPNGSATGNISDDDNAPTATLAPANVAEGTSGTVNKEFTVTLDAASGQPVKIGYTVSAGTATEGTDYSAVPAGELTFAPGATQRKIVVPIIGDNVDEGSGETLFINLSNSDGTVSGASDLGARTITIDDDDNAPVLQTITAITRDEDAAGTAGFVVKLSNPSAQPVSLEVSTADVTTDSDPGTFRDFDPIAAATPVAISAYQTQVTVPVTILTDDIYEDDETATFTAALAGDETDATGGPENATLTLVNDDDAPTVELSASTAAEGGSVTLTATVTGVAQADIPVNVALTGGAGDPADPGD
ncbi:Calx-beta domain-containing protein, partial [Actinoplanes sp. NPDC051633]|uniref:Calx-beta domain-containing protein n=1 Tax=Actinoplanes sp. NPDC051633 TaxID=3155670 RepID=UPI0034172721